MNPARVGLLACSKAKLPYPAPARDLYTGDVFRWASEVLRRRGCDRLVILSALYGALPEWQPVPPYNLALTELPRGDRVAWAQRTGRELRVLVPSGAELLAILPEPYWAAVECSGLAHATTRLFARLPIGRLRGALRTELLTAHAPSGDLHAIQ